MKSLLVVSFSRIANDPRVLRQVEDLAVHFHLTVAGHGPFNYPGVEFIELPSPTDHKLRSRLSKLLLLLRLFRFYQSFGQLEARALKRILQARTFDVVLVNDVHPLPVSIAWGDPDHTVLDCHEYAPMQAPLHRWRIVYGGYNSWLCRKYLPMVRRVSTVSAGIAREYEHEFRLRDSVLVVPNAARFRDLQPSPVNAAQVELLYHGLAGPNRGLKVLIDAMRELDSGFRLNLVLANSRSNYVSALREYSSGLSSVRFLDPFPFDQLVESTNRFDIGVFVCPPTTVQHRYTLPNKLFEYIQARLGVVIGPSPEMAAIVSERGLGKITSGFSASDVAATFASLTIEEVERFKLASGKAAFPTSWENSRHTLTELIGSALPETQLDGPAGRPLGEAALQGKDLMSR